MGSFLGTCGVTQLPIYPDDRVAVFPLIVKPLDFESRDKLFGCGPSGNDLVAQPLGLPLFGVYADYGQFTEDRGQASKATLLKTLEGMVRAQWLHTRKDSLRLVKKATERTLEALYAGELLARLPNEQKAWLKNLQETVNSRPKAERAGFSHYDRYLKMDLATVPDTVDHGFGFMMVHEQLYRDIVTAEGNAPCSGWWDDRQKKSVKFKGSQREALLAQAGLTDAQRTQIRRARKTFETELSGEPDGIKPQDMVAGMGLLLKADLCRAHDEWLHDAMELNLAFGRAVVDEDLGFLGQWADFMLFLRGMRNLRRHWIPQTGAGSSNGYDEHLDVYKAVSAFTAGQLENYARQSDDEATLG